MLQRPEQKNILSQINQIKNMVSSNPDEMYRNLMQNNPEFRAFVMSNKGKSVQQIAKEYGIEPEILK